MSQSVQMESALSIGASDKWLQLQRVALVIQYVGTRFHGWQRQPNERSVQGDLEKVIGAVLGYPVTLYGAGRTDSGVHAAAQVAHFNAPAVIPAHRWQSILNARLPEDILVRASAPVSLDWHAQFSACWRRYRYTLYTDANPNLFIRPFVWHYYYEGLNAVVMRRTLKKLVGYHDLTAFHRARSGRSHSFVDVHEASCQRRGPFVVFELQASGFLYGMVRLIMGLIVQVGRGQISSEEFTSIWQNKERDRVKYSAPARGLCLLRVGYEHFPVAREVWFDALPHFVFGGFPELASI